MVTGLPVCGHAQQPPYLQSKEAFMTGLGNATWECSFTNYPRLRFYADKIELLAGDNKVFGTLKNVSILEPGVIRVDYNNGGMALFIFSEDLKTFVLANMNDISEFDIAGATVPVKLPAGAADPPLEATFKDNPFWKKMRVQADKMEVLDDSGAVLAVNEGFAFYPHALGLKLPDKKAGFVLLSRHRPGGWYLSGKHLGTGVKTELVGMFRTGQSKMRDFAHRTAHFNRPLLRAGDPALAYAQEQYALYNAANVYGESSEQVLYAHNEIGKIRGYERSYDQAAAWHARAYALAKSGFGGDKAKLLEIGTDFAESQGEMGDFAASKATLAEVAPHLPPPGGDARVPYAFYRALGAAEFGLRNYAQAAQIFTANQKRATEGKLEWGGIESYMDLAACQMALNQPLEAAASVSLAMARQEERFKMHPKITYDTYALSLAANAVQKWDEAIRFSAETQRRSSVTYMECARLLVLVNKGDKAAAQKMAQNFARRFGGDLDEVQIRRDIDAMTLGLTTAVAAMTPEATAELERLWAQQVESLRKRPLQNYIFARVMVAAIASLKKGG
ncbi:hypothetical protein EI77_00421 [Prosthecobacter fusiformis]|uniref:Tetratricopeptide repeat protein n=2 Tax=Prosthecobacter fusiformis TaxID=48464 RepID=A0A4R7SR95_9BACT|nr:hypothetical protein EI77_00421 [Prosthecobacter fusiformis]